MGTNKARQARAPGSLLARRERTAWLLLLPAILVIVLVAAYPLYRTVYFSLTDASYLRPGEEKFIGLENYVFLLQDATWWTAVRNTVVFSVTSVLLELLLGLGVALILNSQFRARGLVRAAILIPWAIPTVVSSQMWSWMYQDVLGVVNDIFLRLHLISERVGWLAASGTGILNLILENLNIISEPVPWLPDISVTMASIIAVDVWKTTPFVALLLLAGLQSIPDDIYEAARVDGAGALRQFFRITLPLLKPAILITLIFRTLDALRVFDVIQVMKSTDIATISMSVYDRQLLVEFNKLGYGSAVAVAIFLVISVFTVIYITSSRVRFD